MLVAVVASAAAAVGTETVEVPPLGHLARTAAHGIEWHPSSGQLGGSPGIGWRGRCAGQEGACLASGRGGAVASVPAEFEAWRGLGVQLSIPFSFPPVG